MSMLNTTLQTLVVRLQDMNGHVAPQKLHNRIFDAYEAKSLVFECLTPAHQHVMAVSGGKVPPLHPVGPPLLVEGWGDLVSCHTEHNLYRLLPRRAKTSAAYLVMQAVCTAQGSPFSPDDRVDPLDLKFVFRHQDDQDAKNAFNVKQGQSGDKLNGNCIWLDGVLRAKEDAALVMCYPMITAMHVSNLAGTAAFLKDWSSVAVGVQGRHLDLKKLWKELLHDRPRQHMFLGTQSPPTRDVAALAKSKGIHIYLRKGAQFVFHP